MASRHHLQMRVRREYIFIRFRRQFVILVPLDTSFLEIGVEFEYRWDMVIWNWLFDSLNAIPSLKCGFHHHFFRICSTLVINQICPPDISDMMSLVPYQIWLILSLVNNGCLKGDIKA